MSNYSKISIRSASVLKFSMVALVFVFVSSCKKAKVEQLPKNNDPIFTIKGMLDGKKIDYTAGVDGFFMASEYEKRNRVDYYYGNLNNDDISIKIGFFDDNIQRINNSHNLKIGDTLRLSQKSNQTLSILSIDDFSNANKIESIDWYIDGQIVSQNYLMMSTPGLYQICGEFTFKDGSKFTVCNDSYLAFNKDLAYQIRHFSPESGTANLWLDGNIEETDLVQWYINDKLVGEGTSTSFGVGNTQNQIKAVVTTANGAKRTKIIQVDGNNSGKYIEDFIIESNENQDLHWDRTMGIEITRDGQCYSSFETDNSKAFMVVEKIEFYGKNTLGQNVYKIIGTTTANLKSKTTGEVIQFAATVDFGYAFTE
ncbi:MAG: hypothetical protein ACI9XP_000569 [Lentimonas sp.]|jgi:hypothetical protein